MRRLFWVEWSFSWKNLSGLLCPRRANILVCMHHTFAYHFAIVQLLDKMHMTSLILFLHVFPVERMYLVIYFKKRFRTLNLWKQLPWNTSRFTDRICDGLPRTLWELGLTRFSFYGSYIVGGNERVLMLSHYWLQVWPWHASETR